MTAPDGGADGWRRLAMGKVVLDVSVSLDGQIRQSGSAGSLWPLLHRSLGSASASKGRPWPGLLFS
jgi:hypothetical protein